MTVTAKDLRFHISMLFNLLSKGEDITVTYRGKPKAKLVSIADDTSENKSTEMFGMWRDKDEDVDRCIRNIRSGRNFDI